MIIASGIEITILRRVNKQSRMMKEYLIYQTGVKSTTMTSFTETTSDSHLKREKRVSMLPCVLTTTECMKMQNVETLKALKVKWRKKKRKMKEAWKIQALKKMKKTKESIDESF